MLPCSNASCSSPPVLLLQPSSFNLWPNSDKCRRDESIVPLGNDIMAHRSRQSDQPFPGRGRHSKWSFRFRWQRNYIHSTTVQYLMCTSLLYIVLHAPTTKEFLSLASFWLLRVTGCYRGSYCKMAHGKLQSFLIGLQYIIQLFISN